MKPKWIFTLAFEILIACCFYLWLALDIEGARNAVLFVFWFATVVGLVAGFTTARTKYKDEERTKAYEIYHAATDFIYVMLLAWLGYFTLAALYALASLAMRDARKREPKPN